jgi:hypothetical protein
MNITPVGRSYFIGRGYWLCLPSFARIAVGVAVGLLVLGVVV